MSEKIGPYDPKTMALPLSMETERLIMVPVVEEDFDYHWECRSDADVMAHFPILADDRAELEAEFLDELNVQEKFKFFYGVSFKDTSEVQGSTNRTNTIATVLLRPYNKGAEMELGYMVVKRAWGKGVAPEASKKLINYGFETLNLPHIMAMISPGNEKSERVIKKLGFRFSEKITDDERSPNLNKYVLLREVWEKQNTHD